MTTLTDRLRDDAREMVRLNRGMDHCHQSEKHTLPWQAADEIDRLTNILGAYAAGSTDDMNAIVQCGIAQEELEAEITTLRESLVWYRDAQYDPALSDDIHNDRGKRARDALQKGGRDG